MSPAQGCSGLRSVICAVDCPSSRSAAYQWQGPSLSSRVQKLGQRCTIMAWSENEAGVATHTCCSRASHGVGRPPCRRTACCRAGADAAQGPRAARAGAHRDPAAGGHLPLTRGRHRGLVPHHLRHRGRRPGGWCLARLCTARTQAATCSVRREPDSTLQQQCRLHQQPRLCAAAWTGCACAAGPNVGAAPQTYAMQRALAKYGIIELARTGKICLKRGEELLEMGGWGEALNPPGTQPAEARSRPGPAEPAAQAGPPASGSGDVYVNSDDGSAGMHTLALGRAVLGCSASLLLGCAARLGSRDGWSLLQAQAWPGGTGCACSAAHSLHAALCSSSCGGHPLHACSLPHRRLAALQACGRWATCWRPATIARRPTLSPIRWPSSWPTCQAC